MAFKTPISIYCRIKPSSSVDFLNEVQEYKINPVQDSENDNLIIFNYQCVNFINHKPDSFSFQFVKVFDQDASQVQVYDVVAKPVVESALKGYNGTIFAYGQTGSGKTHTITGDRGNPGVVPRALSDIFAAIDSAEGERYDVQMSYLEIYNEQSNDLLLSAGQEKKKICLRESVDKVLEWHNLSVSRVQTYSEALKLLVVGDNNRIVGDTPMNVFSSRSHTILTIYLTSHVQDSLEVRRAKLNLVDLAGSERVHKAGEEGIVLEEARHINLSLHYLEQVIIALSEPGRSHVPYRNCTLTAALRDSLGGNCMTVMVANITMDRANIEETVSTCRFAQRVSLVRNELTANLERDLSGENSQLKEEIHHLKEQCNSLRAKVRELERKWPKGESLSGESCVKTDDRWTDDRLSDDSNLSARQLKTDIIYMIDWLQELKPKQSTLPSTSNDSALSSFSALNTVEPDEGFDDFVATMKDKEDWTKARETEKMAADALSTQLAAIDSVHQDILDWWKQNEKSLVREMLNGRVINVPGMENTTSSVAAAAPTSSSALSGVVSIDHLLNTHSELLKDFQLLKSRLQSSKRNLQRLKRKYLVEFNSWKKGKVSLDNFFEKIDESGDAVGYANMKTAHLVVNNPMENYAHKVEVKDKNYEKNSKQYFDSKHEAKVKDKNGKKKFKQYFDSKKSDYSSRLNWNQGEMQTDSSLLLNESDLSSVLGDLNNSAFSTSTLLSDSRITLASEPRGHKEPRLVRSVPTTLHTTTNAFGLHSYSASLQLTGDQDIDEEIIAFYHNKRLN